MNKKEKMAMLEEMMELDEGTLEETTVLNDLMEWDSLTKLALIVMLGDEFNKKITSEEIKQMRVVADILEYMV